MGTLGITRYVRRAVIPAMNSKNILRRESILYPILPFLQLLNEVYMSQEDLAAAVSGESKFLHDFTLFGLRHHRTVKVGALSVGITLEFLETLLVMEPFVAEELAAIHATDRNNHRTYSGA
jgi:hypothetical protein